MFLVGESARAESFPPVHNTAAVVIVSLIPFIVDFRITYILSMYNQPPKSPLSGGLHETLLERLKFAWNLDLALPYSRFIYAESVLL